MRLKRHLGPRLLRRERSRRGSQFGACPNAFLPLCHRVPVNHPGAMERGLQQRGWPPRSKTVWLFGVAWMRCVYMRRGQGLRSPGDLGGAGTLSGHRPRCQGNPVNVLSGRGWGIRPRRAVPFLPSLPLSHLPATSRIRVSETRVQMPCFPLPWRPSSGSQAVPEPDARRRSRASVQLRLWEQGLPVASRTSVCGAGASCLCLPPAVLSEPRNHRLLNNTWIAATSSFLHLKHYDFLRGDGISSKHSESLALLRKDLVIEPWETQLLEGGLWTCVVCVCVFCACAHGWVFLRIPKLIQITVEFI